MRSNVVQYIEQEARSEGPAAVKSAVRALDVLEMLSTTPGRLGVSEVARRLGIPKSSVSLLLATLEGRGYVVGDESRRFTLHPVYARGRRGWVGGPRAALVQAARAYMRQLAQATGESAFLAVRRDRQSLEYIEKVISAHEVRCDAELGEPRPLHSTSLGLVILAFQRPDLTDAYLSRPLQALTPRTTIDPARLRGDLATIRREGYAITRDTNAVGASGIAAPVVMTDGGIAALNISAPSSRFDSIVGRAKSELLAAAQALTRELREGPFTDGDTGDGPAARAGAEPS